MGRAFVSFRRFTLRSALVGLGVAALGCGSNPSSSTDGGGGGGSSGGGTDGSDGQPLVDGGSVSGGDGAGPPGPPSPDAGSGPASDAGATSSAGALAGKLGKPARLLIGLGSTDVATIKTQNVTPDIYEQYLVGVGAGSWPTWNSPSGAYVDLVVAAHADSVGAVPMFTLYQMAAKGDGNITVITDPTFMTQYWANVVVLFQRLAIYGKPALVNFEPDFWGYTEQASPGGDPTKLPAKVSIAADCASLPDNLTGLAHCLIQIARKYAPKAYVGLSPSTWGAPNLTDVVTFMKNVGAGEGDIVVMQTLDRDSGCFEAATEADCKRGGSGWYWDETNATHPNFQDHLAEAHAFYAGLNRPLVWWQTPLGLPSATPGGTTNHYRDNRVHYFLTHPAELVQAGGLGVVFGAGAGDCTLLSTDNGQWKTLSTAYFASPAALH